MGRCKRCGLPIRESDYCPHCGAPTSPEKLKENQRRIYKPFISATVTIVILILIYFISR